LDRAAAKIDGAFPNQPLVEAAVRSTIGRTYVLLALAQEGEPHLRKSCELRSHYSGPEQRDTLVAVGDLSFALYNDDRRAEAEKLLRPAVEVARRRFGVGDECTLSLMTHLGAVLYYQMQIEEAAQVAEQVYKTRQRVNGPEDLRTIAASEELATVLISLGEFDDAERLIRDALARYPLDPQVRNPRLCHLYLRLGGALAGQGKLIEAEDAYRRCVEVRTDLYGTNHTMVGYAKLRLAGVKEQLGKLSEAEQLLSESIAVDQNLPSYSRVTEHYVTLARVLSAQGNRGEAEQILARARELAEAKLALPNPPNLSDIQDYATGLFLLGMHAEAMDFLTRALEVLRRSLSSDHAGMHQLKETLERARAATTLPTTHPTP
jgi:tetratricopeptide (TPR) repeat protein